MRLGAGDRVVAAATIFGDFDDEPLPGSLLIDDDDDETTGK
jgi:hypothetical protein